MDSRCSLLPKHGFDWPRKKAEASAEGTAQRAKESEVSKFPVTPLRGISLGDQIADYVCQDQLSDGITNCFSLDL
jgi:hypothetical protein